MLTRLHQAVVAKLNDFSDLMGRVFEATDATPSQHYDEYVRENR